MNAIEIKGPIVSNDDLWIYEWLDLEATAPKSVSKALKNFNGENVEVEINSPGGSVFAGSEIYTTLKSYKGKVTVKIVGLAASAASVIAMAGDTVQISPTAQIMIHNASVVAGGDKNDMDHAAEFLRGIDESISNAYKIKSGLTTNEILELMDNETYMTAKTAIELGLADEIMFENEVPEAVASVGGMLSKEAINKLRLAVSKEDLTPEDLEKQTKEAELNNVLKTLDLNLTIKGHI